MHFEVLFLLGAALGDVAVVVFTEGCCEVVFWD